MKIAILTTDSREHFGEYGNPSPYFGTAPQGLLAGFHEILKTEFGIENPKSKIKDRGHCPEIHVISCTQRPMQSPEKLADNIWFHSLHVPKWGWLKTGYLGCILAVRKKLREIGPDIVHAQGTERDCAISAVFSPYPKVLTIHGNLRLIKKTVGFRPFSALWFQSFLEAFVVPKFDGIICITNYTKTAVEHEAKRTWVVPNAVDPDFLALGEAKEVGSRESKVGSSSPKVLVVANVDARKNQNAFILALDGLAKEREFEVRFFGRCGDDEYGRTFRALVAERPWCFHGGMIGRDALRDEFANATALALPTHEDNCPMVVLEAQAAGLPVMASNVGGVPDLVEDGVTGLLTNPNVPESMSRAIERLLTDTLLIKTLARNGRSQALRRFHPRAVAEQHVQIYGQTMAANVRGIIPQNFPTRNKPRKIA